MSRTTYSTPLLLCLCALSFIAGRFIQQIPGLPESNRGVRHHVETLPLKFIRDIVTISDGAAVFQSSGVHPFLAKTNHRAPATSGLVASYQQNQNS